MKNSMRPKPAQLSVIAVAALAIVAVAAAMLLAGGNPAQATTAATSAVAPDDSGGGIHLRPMQRRGTPTPAPRTFPAPPACPEVAAPAFDSDHIALFDVWWNPDELELTNSSCPPIIERNGSLETRSPSSINIDETVIHIPNSAKITLTEADYPRTKYPKLWLADDAENPDGAGDGIVWKLPACPPDGSSDNVDLCIAFSAALLNEADWNGVDVDGDGVADGDIVYHMDHVHQVDIDKQDARYVLAYDVTDEGSELHWSSYDARVSRMPVPAGGYERPEWFFTSRGSYEFQVHITGDTNLSLEDSVNKNPSVNSDVRTYVLHVGAEADVGVGVMVTPESASPGDDVTIKVKASNAGPETAPGTKVEVSLPEGLTYSSHVAATGTSYDSTTAVWDIRDLAKDASKTLTITARVDEGTRGQELKVKATISATETLNIKEVVKNEQGEDEVTEVTYYVPVPDKVSGNDMAMDTVTVTTMPNVNPVFGIERSVAENTLAGAKVGPRIVVKEPDEGDPQPPTLAGSGKSSFTVSLVDGGAQIAVAQGASLDHECRGHYSLTLQVTDGKDENGNPDTLVDDTIPVDVLITNDESDDPTLTFTLDRIDDQRTAHMSVTHTPSHLGRPDCHDRFSFWEYQLMELVNGEWVVESDDELNTLFTYTAASGDSHTFRVDLVGTRGDASEFRRISSNSITVNWP